MTEKSCTLSPISNHRGHDTRSQITRGVDSGSYSDDSIRRDGVTGSKKRARLAAERDVYAKEGDEQDQWNKASRRTTPGPFVGDRKYHQQ